MKDYYKILGVTKSSGEEDIRKRYRKLAMQNHPDRNPDTPGAEERFKEIAEAYGVLTDPVKRREYDAFIAQGGAGAHNGRAAGGFSYSQEDILRDLFSDPRFQMMLQGLLREFQRSGFRSSPFFLKKCFFGGRGGLFIGGLFFFGSLVGPSLLGAAKRGSLGKSSVLKTIGNTVGSLLGMGKGGRAEPVKKGLDTTYHIALSAEELRQGKRIQVALQGEKGQEVLKVKVPPDTKPGQKLRVRGKGQPGPHGRGDLFLCLEEENDISS